MPVVAATCEPIFRRAIVTTHPLPPFLRSLTPGLCSAPALMAAMNKIAELDMSDIPEMDKARKAMEALGEQSAQLLKLQAALAASDLDAIEDALKKLDKMGLGDEQGA